MNCYFLSPIALALIAGAADAGVILSPVSILQNTGGEHSSPLGIANTIDQSGLSTGFSSGLTDFDAYLASNPLHFYGSMGNEWFTPRGVTSSTIIYDLGAVFSIGRLALWNEEVSGILSITVSTSIDPAFAVSTAAGTFAPANSPPGQSYPAQVFALAPSTGQYVRLQVTGPQPGGFAEVSMGEIAFDVAATSAVVPEPTTFALLTIGGFGLLGGWYRKRRQNLGA